MPDNELVWSTDSRACKNTWMLLAILDEVEEIFKKAGTIKMNQLITWNPAATDAARATWAGGIATELDGLLRTRAGGTYKKDKDFGTATVDMQNVMVDAAKTLLDLAKVVDGTYQFPA